MFDVVALESHLGGLRLSYLLGKATSASRARVPFFCERGAQALARSFSVCTSATRCRLSPVQVVNRAAVPVKQLPGLSAVQLRTCGLLALIPVNEKTKSWGKFGPKK